MPYHFVRGARNTIRIPVRRVPRRWGRGLGQTGIDCVSLDANGNCVTSSGAVYDQSGDLVTSAPSSTFPVTGPATATGALPATYLPTGEAVATQYAVGYQGTCPPGQYVIDANGDCGPASDLPSGVSPVPSSALTAAGLTPAQIQAAANGSIAGLTAAQITALANAGVNIARAATGQPVVTGTVTPVSTNPFASISSTVWIAGAALLALVLVLSKKR